MHGILVLDYHVPKGLSTCWEEGCNNDEGAEYFILGEKLDTAIEVFKTATFTDFLWAWDKLI